MGAAILSDLFQIDAKVVGDHVKGKIDASVGKDWMMLDEGKNGLEDMWRETKHVRKATMISRIRSIFPC